MRALRASDARRSSPAATANEMARDVHVKLSVNAFYTGVVARKLKLFCVHGEKRCSRVCTEQKAKRDALKWTVNFV